jgi:hypothetical protein
VKTLSVRFGSVRLGLIAALTALYSITFALCVNMTETPCVTAISEQGGKEKTQNGNDEHFRQTRDTREQRRQING